MKNNEKVYLTKSETKVLEQVKKGLTAKEIAKEIDRTLSFVYSRLKSLKKKGIIRKAYVVTNKDEGTKQESNMVSNFLEKLRDLNSDKVSIKVDGEIRISFN